MTDPGVPQRPDPSPPAADDAEAASRMARLRAQQARVLTRLEGMRAGLEQRRPRSQMIDSAFRAFEHDVAAGGGVLAGAVAFRVFLFLVPYSFVVVVGLGFGADAKHHDAGDLARAAGIGGLAAKAMASVGDLSTTQRIISLVVATFALLLATRALLKVLRIVHALIWQTRAGKLPKTNRAALVLVLMVTLAFAIALFVGRLRDDSLVLGILGTALFIAVPIVLWTFASAFLPHGADVPWTALLPGGVVFGLGTEVLHVVTIYWISHEVDSKTATYGAIGFALALLLWAYLLGRLVTTSAIVNETLWTRYQERLAAHRAHEGDSPASGDERA
jgi:membrane protein